MRILFVCAGNTCRSPMATGIARKLLKDNVSVGSAGIDVSPFDNTAKREAIETLREIYETDISSHHPTQLHVEDCNQWDIFIALDEHIYRRLIGEYKLSPNKVIEWRIDDPYMKGNAAYRICAYDIHEKIKELVEEYLLGYMD